MENYQIKTNTGLNIGEHGNFIDAKKIALKWLEHNIGSVNVFNRITFSVDTFKNPAITKDNIHLYYEFMSDEDKETYRDILHIIHAERYKNIKDTFIEDGLIFNTPKGLDNDILFDNYEPRKYEIDTVTYYYDVSYFGIKDTLKPIKEYIKEIKESEQYKEYMSKKVA